MVLIVYLVAVFPCTGLMILTSYCICSELHYTALILTCKFSSRLESSVVKCGLEKGENSHIAEHTSKFS
jgi:hypothetical protein